MSNPEDKTAAQTLFLRAFRYNPAGPPPQDSPAPGTFRRWLKKESFRKALASIRDALRFQADLHVATAAAQAAKSLQAALPAAAPLDPPAVDLTATEICLPTPPDLDYPHASFLRKAETCPPNGPSTPTSSRPATATTAARVSSKPRPVTASAKASASGASIPVTSATS